MLGQYKLLFMDAYAISLEILHTLHPNFPRSPIHLIHAMSLLSWLPT